jgi:anti-sigma factor ChrR (cupin superfamily)
MDEDIGRKSSVQEASGFRVETNALRLTCCSYRIAYPNLDPTLREGMRVWIGSGIRIRFPVTLGVADESVPYARDH